jgi:WD40 repeat protein
MTELATTDAFISYSRTELDFVRQLADDLISGQKEPWFDRRDVPLRGIPAGSEWWHEIEQGIEAADNLIFVISPDAVASPYCNAEIAHALKHGKRRITVMPCQEDEAASLAQVSQAIQAIPEEEVVPEAIVVPERQLKKLAYYNWQRMSAVQYIPFKTGEDWTRPRQELIRALDQDIERVRALSELQRNAAAWEQQGRDRSFLPRGEALRDAETLLAESAGQDPEPSPLQMEYVAAGRQDESRRRRLQAGAVTAALLLILAAVVAAVLIRTNAVRTQAELERTAAEERASLEATAAAEQKTIANTAVAAKAEAEAALRVAVSRQLAAEAARQLDRQTDLALLLSVEALRMEDTLEAQGALLDGLGRGSPVETFLYGPSDTVQALAYSPDGSLLAAGTCLEERYFGLTECVRGGVYLWDTDTGALLRVLEVGLVGSVPALAFSPDGRWLAAGGCHEQESYAGPMSNCIQGAVELWDVAAGEPAGPALLGPRNESAYYANQVGQLAFSPDGRWLAASGLREEADWAGTVTVWDVERREPAGEELRLADGISGLAFSPDGAQVAASSYVADTVALWDLSAGPAPGAVITMTFETPGQLAFNPDGTLLAVSHSKTAVTLVDTAAWQPAGEPLAADQGIGGQVAFSADGTYLATTGSGGGTSNDNQITIWDVGRGRPVYQLRSGTPWAVSATAFSPQGHRLASGAYDGTTMLWNLDALHPLASPLTDQDVPAMSVAYRPDGQVLASGGGDGVVRLWDATTGTALESFQVSETGGGVTSLAFSPDGEALIAGTFDWGENVALIDLAAGRLIGSRLAGHTNESFSVAFSPAGDVAASSSLDGTIILWDPASGKALSEPLTDIPGDEGHSFRSNDVWSIAFTPGGDRLVAGRGGGDVLIWDVAAQQPAGEPIYAHTGGVLAVAVSPDGQLLATGGGDWFVRLWYLATGEPAGEALSGHTDDVFTLAFSPDGSTLASGGWDGTIRLWDVASGRAIGQGMVAGATANSIAFSPDGETLASDGRPITLWDLRRQAWTAAACRIANRDLTRDEWARYLGALDYQATCSQILRAGN